MQEKSNNRRHRECFRMLLQAMAHPGRRYQLNGSADGAEHATLLMVLETLLDHEVGFCFASAADDGLLTAITETTGSRPVALETADYIIITDADAQNAIAKAKKGTLAFPDQGATLIFLVGDGAAIPEVRLSGPGVPPSCEQKPEVGGLSPECYQALANANASFPLGVDCIVMSDCGAVMCLPRSLLISMAGGQ